METTEKVVEAYCRYVKNLFTLPNIRCGGQFEIDLLAISPGLKHPESRYHIECGVSISGSFSKLTDKAFSPEIHHTRVGQPQQRRTLGFFIARKFNPPPVLRKLAQYGFLPGNYSKVIVSWGWLPEAECRAAKENIQLWDFRALLQEIADQFKNEDAYLTDDTLRTLQLYAKAAKRKA